MVFNLFYMSSILKNINLEIYLIFYFIDSRVIVSKCVDEDALVMVIL